MAPNTFTLPDADTARSGYSVELPPGLAAEVERVRIVANALLPHPLALERAMACAAPEELRSYTQKLYPLASIGHALEGEILAAFSRGPDALERLALHRRAAWALFLEQYAQFFRSTKDQRAKLGFQLDPPELFEPLGRVLRGERIAPETLPGVERGAHGAPGRGINDAVRRIEASIDALEAETLLSVAHTAKPLTPKRVPEGDPLRLAWEALLVWAEHVARRRAENPPDPAPADAPRAPRGPRDAADLLRTVERERVAQALQRHATLLGRWTSKPLERTLAPYLASVAEHQAGLPHEARDAALLAECATLLETTRSISRDARPLERVLHRVRTAWRSAPLPLRIGLGAACAGASLFGGPAAPLGVAGAIALRAAASVATTDGAWEYAERVRTRRALAHPRGLRDLGRRAWTLQWNARGEDSAAKPDADRLMEQVRAQLRTSADLGTLVRGLSAGARMRPFHALGKLAASAAMLFGASFADAGAVVTETRASVGDVLSAPPAPPVLGGSGIPQPPPLQLHVAAAGDANGLDVLLRPHVLREMERRGVPLDAFDAPMQARALNATANIARTLPDTVLHPGDTVSVGTGSIAQEVQRSLERPTPSGAMPWVNRVAWPKWIARARAL